MFRKIILVSSMIAVSSSIAFADATPYLGASLGYNNNDFTVMDAFSNKTTFNSNGLTGGLFAGYGAVIPKNIYLGGEVFWTDGSNSTATKQINYGTYDAWLKTTYSVGLSFIPGIMITDKTMVYARIGGVATRFRWTETLRPGNFPITGLMGGWLSQVVAGSQVGLGLQREISRNLLFRGEVSTTDYHSFTTFSGFGFSNSIQPTNTQVNFGLAYKFG